MKEKDIERVIDDMITAGLIKESEQDNADFEAAVRNMSEEDFLSMIYDARPEETPEQVLAAKYEMAQRKAYRSMAQPSHSHMPEAMTTEMPKRKAWRVWVGAMAAAAAILLIVLIPAYHNMNARVCDGALLVAESYMGPARSGMDFSKVKIKMIKDALPSLEAEYEAALAGNATDPYAASLEEAGLDLAIAYLRLGERSKAKGVFSVLAERYADDEFGVQCRKIAEIL